MDKFENFITNLFHRIKHTVKDEQGAELMEIAIGIVGAALAITVAIVIFQNIKSSISQANDQMTSAFANASITNLSSAP